MTRSQPVTRQDKRWASGYHRVRSHTQGSVNLKPHFNLAILLFPILLPLSTIPVLSSKPTEYKPPFQALLLGSPVGKAPLPRVCSQQWEGTSTRSSGAQAKPVLLFRTVVILQECPQWQCPAKDHPTWWDYCEGNSSGAGEAILQA